MTGELSDLINSRIGSKRPFVIYRKPGNSKIQLITQTSSDLYRAGSYSDTGFVMVPFSDADQAILIRPDEHIQLNFQPTTTGVHDRDPDTSLFSRDENEHKSKVARAIAAIEEGSLEKVVLARKIDFDLPFSPARVFENLLVSHPNAFCYWWYHPQAGTWIGASPELFLAVSNDILTTFSLAGTISAEGDKPPLWTEKELNEQQLVTDYILESLSQSSMQAKTTAPESFLAGRLWHLKSTITANCETSNLEDIIKTLHPTPAVCGLPLEEAKKFIRTNEGFDRKFYTGFIGEVNFGESGHTELYVNLRCMEWQKPVATVYVGGGITSDSDPSAEWLETQAKSRTVLNAVFNYEK